MKEKITIRISNKSKEVLKKIVGKKLKKIAYCESLHFSLMTILVFDDIMVKVSSDEYLPAASADLPIMIFEEYNGPLEYFNGEALEIAECYEMIKSIQIVKDKVTWEDNGEEGFFDTERMVIFDLGAKQLTFYVWSTVSVEMYFEDNILDTKLSLDAIWDIDAENVKRERTFEEIK